ncbi:hypothetical protein WH87_11005 [Devosia epidermidihirudinis]|uniref:Uncharacterized protein n=1 Tax=Devosia epidermidihirudinis TaxID=1293439 RepID=A0A0F5QB03_9HYPH|nr:hypothetical protein WH87_11005 [Devosia epidermidihirudinis]
MVSLSNHEVGLTDAATTSSFDELRMRSTGCFAALALHTHGAVLGLDLRTMARLCRGVSGPRIKSEGSGGGWELI